MKMQLEMNEQMPTNICSSFSVDAEISESVDLMAALDEKSGSSGGLDYSKHHEFKSQTS